MTSADDASNSIIDLHHLLSLHDENAWSDLLATLIESDPTTWAHLARTDDRDVRAEREVKLRGDAGRIDLHDVRHFRRGRPLRDLA